MNDTDFMREALREAEAAAREGELPVGCVIVKDGAVIARAHNSCEADKDATAHAELLAIRRASAACGDWRLNRCALYVTLEPCPMCAGAIMQARVGRLVYGAANPEQGCAGSLYRIPEDPAFPHFCPSDGGILAGECQALMDRFFAARRSGKEDASLA
ncbi:MAG: nucleoside deaminase [Clostridia bacterium]|nr:nucleoside deaminase [Clostridia bacterium]